MGIAKTILLGVLCTAITACGGSNTPSDSGATESTDMQSTGSTPSSNSGPVSNTNGQTATQINNTSEIDYEATLRWPDDFPAGISADFSKPVRIVGLPTNAVYEFEVASANTSVYSLLQVLNGPANGTYSEVCTGDTVCSGTVTAPHLTLGALNRSDPDATLTITPTGERPLINQGTPEQPHLISAAAGNVNFEGSVASWERTLDGDVIISESYFPSYYRVTDLTVGSRYSMSITSDAAIKTNYTDGSEILCDPKYSASFRIFCVFIPTEPMLDIPVRAGLDAGRRGAAVDIDIELINNSNAFEGSWHTPVVLAAPEANEKVTHIGRADKYSSFYSLTDLDPTSSYKITVSAMTASGRLKLNSPLTSSPAAENLCSIFREGEWDQACYVRRAPYAYFRVSADEENIAYVISIETGPEDAGTTDSPHMLFVDDKNRIYHNASVNHKSVYQLNGLRAGDRYRLTRLYTTHISSDEIPKSWIEDPGTGIKFCEHRGSCAFEVPSTSLLYVVDSEAARFGMRINFGLSPTSNPGNEDSQNLPHESLTLNSSNLPHSSTWGLSSSEYEITDLAAEQYYLVTLQDPTEDSKLTIKDASRNDNCENETGIHGGSCLGKTSVDGKLEVEVGGNVRNGHFTLALSDPLVFEADYRSADTPIQIPQLSQDTVISEITVQSSNAIAIPTVTIALHHKLPEDLIISLESPDGQLYTLAERAGLGAYFSSIVFSDLAADNIPADYFWSWDYKPAYRPAQQLVHALNGTDPSGVWRLHVKDVGNELQGGVLLGWGINF